MNQHDRLSVTCARGLEGLLAVEIESLGASDLVTGSGVVQCLVDKEGLYRICLESRLVASVLLPLTEFDVRNVDDLYRNARLLPWMDWFGYSPEQLAGLAKEESKQKKFALRVSGGSESIRDNQFASLRLKDAIADYFRAKTGSRPNVSKDFPDLCFHLFIDKTSAAISLDLGIRAMHERGYRVQQGEAPIKESLASAIIFASQWDKALHDDVAPVLIDPMCGSGTLLIEAALMAQKKAPRLYRKNWGFSNWQGHSKVLWNKVWQDADKSCNESAENMPRIIGYDSNPDMVNAAKINAEKAGVLSLIHFERADIANLPANRMVQKLKEEKTPVTIVTNPPYGLRLDDELSSEYLHAHLGQFVRKSLPQARLCLISASRKGLDRLGLQENSSLTVYNGPVRSWIKYCEVNEAKQVSNSFLRLNEVWLKEGDLDHQKAGLANRLVKNYKKLKPWMKKNSIQSYRLYDADLPEFNFALDVYGKHVHFQEYKAPKTVDEEKARQRLSISLNVVKNLFSLKPSQLHKKTRTRQKGEKQYQKQASKNKYEVIVENGVSLLVNLDDYLDSGLFLDHRPVREMIKQQAEGKSFLNLYAYTSSVSIFAAAGGARSTVSIDTSAAYLGWAKANFSLNGFSSQHHQLIQADVMKWLGETGDQFDLIFIDPPTFSNSKSRDKSFDVQEDHYELLMLAKKHLHEGGKIIFSNNFRRFKLDERLEQEFFLKDITAASIPEDFKRNQKIHHCWELS